MRLLIMIEQLRNDINSARNRLSVKFIFMSYIGCSIFNILFGTYKELGLIFVTILTLMWVINNTEKEYAKIRDRFSSYPQSDDSFVISGLISVKTAVLFVLSFIAFLSIQFMLFPPYATGAYVAYFIYLSIVMIAINGEYNPLALDKRKEYADNSKTPYEEYHFREHPEGHKKINDLWYRDVCLPGNPIFIPPPKM